MAASNISEWQLFDGSQWSSICNANIIETHYCQPGASGITLHTSIGSLYIDFDAMTVSGICGNVLVRRNTFLSINQKQDVGWYYKDNKRWCQYGAQGAGGNKSSITSDYIEQQYNQNPNGSVRFSAGHMTYIVDFTAMTQTNLSTHMNRKVRRRPKFNSIVTVNNSSPTSPSLSVTPTNSSAECIWEFMGEEGIWSEYQKPGCSLDSQEVERLYQLNPQSQVSFTAGRQSYILDFSGMHQVNMKYGTKRHVRRIAGEAQETNSQFSQACWQFKDMDGHWKNYSKGGSRGHSSVSSQDIEAQYQEHAVKISFRAGRFNYELNFSDMTQTNLSTNTIRSVRRIEQ
ncbi:hypothetical protein E1301_Tti020652 [Triplophysa tibetana]|uniref:WWE domain-containing protein n=1 Tax=Triplophysa tibetana TaxID=1572043 RepID=A0A5A9PJL0_9TELE|nr:hypothetical protein E1301_Tti020652 [Triplophysa tibetana]